MADKPILFSGPMVRALLAGTKTQTRRVLKPQPSDYAGNPIPPDGRSWTSKTRDEPYFAMHDDQVHWCWWDEYNRQGPDWIQLRVAKGDRLWVKETWRPIPLPMDPWDMEVAYNADGERRIVKDGEFGEADWNMPKAAARGNVTPLFMPRWASRLTLTVTDVRVERLNDCTATDALAEGVSSTSHWRPKDVEGKPFQDKWWDDFTFWSEYPQIAYRELWDAINGSGAWEANPWVAAYTFTVEHCNIDQVKS